MKHLVKFFVVTFFLLICTYSLAEQKVVYIDLKFVLNNSKAGKGAQDYLKKTFKSKQDKFTKMEKTLKKEEENLIAKKSEISQEEYKKQADALRKKVVEYQAERRKSLEKITKQRAEARSTLLQKLDPILVNYINENNVSMVVDKKNVIAGKNNFDITNIIVEKLNKELPSLNLK